MIPVDADIVRVDATGSSLTQFILDRFVYELYKRYNCAVRGLGSLWAHDQRRFKDFPLFSMLTVGDPIDLNAGNYIFEYAGILLQCDKAIPGDEVHFKDGGGTLLGRIVHLG